MKKFVVFIIVIIILIFLIAILKGIKTTKYSHSDIVDLINKGTHSMNNVSFVKETVETSSRNLAFKYYIKGNKCKIIYPDNVQVNIILEDGKVYMINYQKKEMFVTAPNTLTVQRGLQDDALQIEPLNADDMYKDEFRYEFEYIRDEKIDNKDCIFVKECLYNLETKKYTDSCRGRGSRIPVYWIEKSTGFVIGSALMEQGKNKATPETIIKDIECGEVTDNIFNDMFEIPNDYNVIESTRNN